MAIEPTTGNHANIDIEVAPGVAPIAITGIGCRFPGACGAQSFWAFLCAGGDAISEVPNNRFDIDLHYDPTPAKPGKTESRWGGFIDDIDAFDAAFFGISPREAKPMDPQQRLLLEVAWEALEDAGEVSATLAGSRTGVFVGMSGSDYWDMQSGGGDYEIYDMIGSASRATAAGRIAFAFDLRGPTLTVDSTCSTSLVAVHLACESIRSGDSKLALAGAANAILAPTGAIMLSRGQILSPDGRCKFADEQANGFVRSEGVAVVVLKPLAAAMANGDQIYALILGSSVNNDGRGSGQLMTPAGSGQRDLLRSAYQRAQIDPTSVDYLEAHGTGTAVGDPIELQATASVLAAGRSADTPLLVGSVKTNIGHTEATAGMAGLIKAALCLKHRAVPATLHHHRPTPAIDWETVPLAVPRELTPLTDKGRPAIAGVNSFGISGANAHAVLCEARTVEAPRPPEQHDRPHLLALSARGPAALRDLAGRYAAYLAPDGPGRGHALRDICHSASTRRTHFESRLAAVGATHDEIANRLECFLADEECREVSAGPGLVGPRPRIAFVFPGQGSQWAGMGRELLASCPPFADAMRECDNAVRRETGWSVIAELTGRDDSRLTQLDVVQPTLWAMEVALAQLWRSWGIEPDIVIGHSMGEIAAACVAGALSHADAAAVICRRSAIARRRSGHGAMAVVELSAEELAPMLDPYVRHLAVAASNSPASTVVSGAPAAIDELLTALDRSGVVGRRIDVDFASHSPQMDDLVGELEESLTELRPRAEGIPIHSAVYDARVDGTEFNGTYWARNLRDPVLFSAAVRNVAQDHETIFLEISPHPVLTADIEECLRTFGLRGSAFGSLRRTESEWASLLATLGALYTTGHEPTWDRVNAGAGTFVRLPGYPWQHERFWIDRKIDTKPAEPAEPAEPADLHPLLDAPLPVPTETGRYVWEGRLDRARNAFLDDHRAQGAVIFPGAAYLEVVTAAGRAVFRGDPVTVEGIDYRKVLSLREGEPPCLRVTLTRAGGETWQFEIESGYPDEELWLSHATGTVRRAAAARNAGSPEPAETVRDRCDIRTTRAGFYDRFGGSGNEWRERFQTIDEIWHGSGEALARIRCPDSIAQEVELFHFHPALLDGCMQAFAAALPQDTAGGGADAFVMVGTDEVRILRPALHELWSHVRVHAVRESSVIGDVTVFDDDGDLIAELLGVRFRYLGGGRLEQDRPSGHDASDRFQNWLYTPSWRRVERPREEPPPGGPWLVLTDALGIGAALVERFEAAGHGCVSVTAGWSYAKLGPRRYRANPGSSQDMGRVVRDALAEIEAAAWAGVVNLWNVEADTDDIESAHVLGCDAVTRLVHALVAEQVPPRLWLVTQGAQSVTDEDPVAPAQALVWGLGRVIAGEHPELRCTLVDLDPRCAERTESAAALWAELCAGDEENQLAWRGSARFALRLAAYEPARREPGRDDTTTVRVNVPAPGSAAGIALRSAERIRPGPGEVEIEVAYAALNHRDVSSTTGTTTPRPAAGSQLLGSQLLGWECSGRVSRLGDRSSGLDVGDEVIACGVGGLARHVIATSGLVFRKPSGLSLAEAATVPVAFLTAYHALGNVAHLGPDDHVLIHAATAGSALAAVQIVRWRGAETLVAVDSDEDREVLDAAGVRHITDSRSPGCADEIRSATAGHGVDVILDMSAGGAIGENIPLLAPYGRYVELGPRSVAERRIDLGSSAGNLTFSCIDIGYMIQREPARAGVVLRDVLGLVEAGALSPLPYKVFPADRAAAAFSHLTETRPTDKILLAFDDVPVPRGAAVRSRPAERAMVRSDAAYLITGGLGGIGLTVARRLVRQGARHLLLIGRSTAPSGETRPGVIEALRDLERAGAKVVYEALDVTDGSALHAALERFARGGGPAVRGVVHAAGVVRMTPVTDLAAAGGGDVLGPKTKGAWALRQALADADLDFFVLCSSTASLLGPPMMGAYAAGNAFLDAFAHRLRRSHVPAMCVNWGVWTVGMTPRLERDHGRTLVPDGVRAVTPEEGADVFEALLAEDIPQVMVMPTDWERWRAAHSRAASSPLLRELLDDPRPGGRPGRPAQPAPVPKPRSGSVTDGFAPPTRPPTRPPATDPVSVPMPAPVSAPVPVSAPEPAGDAERRSIADYLTEQIVKVTGIPMEKLNPRLPLIRQGLDSLMAHEVRNRIRERVGVTLAPMTLLGERPLAEITEELATLLTVVKS